MNMSSLTIMQFNLENFFIFLDRYKGENLQNLSEEQWQSFSLSLNKSKPLNKIWPIAKLLLIIKPDIVLVNEAGGMESLKNFCNLFLQDTYTPYLVEGNSDRGIDIGYLIRSDLKQKFLLISHKNRPINFLYDHEKTHVTPEEKSVQLNRFGYKRSHYFSRDVSELRIFKDELSHSPALIILGVHLKSKLDSDGVDPQGRSRRTAELKTLIEIYQEIVSETHQQVPILIGGDFNGNASPIETEPEFLPLYQNTDLHECLELLKVPPDHRYTQITYDLHGNPRPVQIDYFFVNQLLCKNVEQAFVYRFKDESGMELPPPRNPEERNILPSDHYPVVLKLKNILTF